MANIRNLDSGKIKVCEKSYKNILIYHITYKTKNSVERSCLVINKKNRHLGESQGNKYLALVPADKSKGTLTI